VKTTIRLEVARDVGQYLVTRAQDPAAFGKDESGNVARAGEIAAYAVVDHLDALPIHFGVLVALPVRWADAGIACVEADQLRRVAGTDAAAVVEGTRKLGVKTDVRAAAPIEELEIKQQASGREDILQEQRFAPRGMGADHVGNEALPAQFECQPCHRLTTADRRLAAAKVVVCLPRGTLRLRVAKQTNARMKALQAPDAGFLANGEYLVCR